MPKSTLSPQSGTMNLVTEDNKNKSGEVSSFVLDILFERVVSVCIKKTLITEYTLAQTQFHSVPLHFQLLSADTPSETFFTFFSS
jgi:hypothetical protein